MKQLEVTIMGQSYILGCPEGHETSLLEAVSEVDREMCAIRDAGKVKARERIAVLAALNLAYALAERPAAGAASRGPAAGAASAGPAAGAASAGPAAGAASAGPAAGAASGGPAAASAASAAALGGPDLSDLVRRLDNALGNDGRLL